MGKVWDVVAPRNLELGPLAGQATPSSSRAGSPWRNWMLARDEDGIAWLALDKPDASANTLSEDVLAELNAVLASLERDMPKGLVLRSAKPKGFIAGADIGEFRGMTDARAVQARLIQAHAVVDRLDRLAAPTVAVVHGYCLGGGLEIALAFDHPIPPRNAPLGFPQAMLRLPPYPAPHALIDLWETHGGNAQAMQRAEIASFARLVVTDTSRNLVRVFFLREKLKGLADGDFSGQHVHVIGAGAMGGDIAAWCAWQGFTVTLADTQADAITRAGARAADLYGKIGHRHIDIRDALDRLTPDLAGEGVRSADLVIEAVPA